MWLKCGVLLLFALFANYGEAGNCNMPGESEWNTALRFQVNEKEYDKTKQYKIENIKAVEFNFKYLDYKLDINAETLTFSLKEEFKKYVENEELSQIDTSVKFTCSDNTKEDKSLTLLVTQTELRKPEIIGKDNLEFKLKMPILPNTLIPAVEIKISEKNLDMDVNNINVLVLGSCADSFEFHKEKTDVIKVFKATLKSKDASVTLDKPVTCNIEVNTIGGKDEAQMKLNVDIKESVPPNPQFEESLYTRELNDNNEIDPVQIKLLNQIFTPNITWDTDVYKDHFNFDDQTMTFSSLTPLPADAFDGRNFITVKIEANYAKADGPGRTVIIISPKDTGIREIPEFVKPLYVAQYENPNKITVEDIELKSADRNADFVIDSVDGFKDNFHFQNNKLTVTNLPENVFKDRNSISITIEATYENVPISDKTVVIVNGPEKIIVEKPVFKKPLYETQYEDANTINIEDILLEQTEIKYSVDFDINADNKQYFEFDNNKFKIVGLPETEFDGKNYISVEIVATYEYKGVQSSGKTVVIIKPPDKIELPTLVFKKPLYTAEYVDENTLQVEKILLQSVDDSRTLKFDIISEHKQYFDFQNDVLSITGLPKDVFGDKNYILVEIEAKYLGTDISGRTTVLINGPKETEIQELVFVKSLYEGQYENENKLNIEDIELVSADPNKKVDFKIISEHETYFKFENKKLTINGLPTTVFGEKNFILITIEANYKGEQAIGKTNVLINGPKEIDDNPILVFVKSLYESQYENENSLKIEDIKLVSADPNKEVEFKVISEHKTYFKFENEKLTINGLPTTVFVEKNFILITIEANYKGKPAIGRTNVLINGPKEIDDNPIPVFVKTLYEGQYENENSLKIEDIKLVSADPNKEVEFKVISEHKTYFKFTNEKLTINGLPTTVFGEKNFILITIEANYKGKPAIGKTNVLINGPKEIDENTIPVFVKSLYEAQYENKDKITVEAIKLVSDDPNKKIEFKIVSEHEQYFKFANNKLTIQNLPDTVFDNNYILITIEAKYKDAKNAGKTTVLINGPTETEIPTAVFKKPSYDAKYKNPTTIEHEEILLQPTNKQYTAEYEIISAYAKHFKFDSNTHKLIVIDPLSEDIFDDKNFISVTIRATYTDATNSGYTVVIINAPDDLVLEFVKPLYEAQYKDKDTITVEEIKLKSVSPGKTVTYKIITDINDKYFSFDDTSNELKVHNLPTTVFDGQNFISIKIQATYDGTKISAETTIIIKGPENNEIPTAMFEKPSYDAKYKNPTTIEHEEILLQPTNKQYTAEYEIISAYAKHFKFDSNTHKLIVIDPLSEDIFDDKNFISVTIQATYKDASSSGYTVVIINAPDDLVLEFVKPLYEAQYKDKDTIDVEKIELKSVSPGKTVSYKIVTDINENYFSFDDNTNELKIHNLPVAVFDDKNFISIKIQATYDGTKISAETTVIIKGPENNEVPTAVFEKSLYDAQYINENKIDVEDINLIKTSYTPTFKIIAENIDKTYFIFNKNKLQIKDLPVTVFDKNNFISITIQATYDGSLSTGETVVIINGPKKTEIPTAIFEKPSYDAKYINPTTIEHEEILLQPTNKQYTAEYEIISAYEKHFKFDSDTHKLIVTDPLSEDIFDEKNFISVTIRATYIDASSSGYTVVVINSPKSSDAKHKIYFDKQADVSIKDSPITGFVGIYKAISDDSSEKIIYSIDKSSISNLFEYNNDGVLNVIGNLPAQPYYQITLSAKGEKSGSEAKMDVILIDKKETNIAGFKFANRLEIHNVLEHSGPNVIVPILKNHKYNIVDDNSEGWFEIDKQNGNLILNKIDREDSKLKDMLVAQVKTKIQAEEITQLSTKYNKLQYGLKQFKKQDYCIDVTTIPNSYKELYVVVTIEDINDHSPVFKGDNPLTIGYPSSEIAEYVAPPYLVKVEATDEDTGINAKIRYSVDKNFKIDPENGIIYPSESLSSDTEFTATATDKDGADDGNSTPLQIKVKILKEEHITIITTNNIAYNEIDGFIENLSKETGTTVKYLSSTALPKSDEIKSLRLTKDDDKISKLRIVLYAFDNDKIVPSPEFRKKIEGSSISESVTVTEYESPETIAAQGQDKGEDETSDSGWIAAVSTLSVLLALVIFGVIGFYIFYLRPKLYGGPIKYEKHSDNESIHTSMAPVELKMESSRTIDRRATGFPIGFNPSDLDDDEDEDDLDSVKEELPEEEVDEGINDSEVSSTNEQERRKSVVKFDVNVTEIEISEL